MNYKMDISSTIIVSTSILGAFTAFGVTLSKIFDNRRKIHPTCKRYHQNFDAHIKENTDKLKTLDTVNAQMGNFKDRITKQEEKIDEMNANINTQAVKIGEITTTLTHIEDSLKRIAGKLSC